MLYLVPEFALGKVELLNCGGVADVQPRGRAFIKCRPRQTRSTRVPRRCHRRPSSSQGITDLVFGLTHITRSVAPWLVCQITKDQW